MAVIVGQQPLRGTDAERLLHVGALRRWWPLVLATATALLISFHYIHLAADFPHDAPWKDPARTTDEGWYAGAALRALLSGHWRLPGDFNPAAALPVFPTLAYLLFRITGVSVIVLRALNVSCMAASVLVLWVLARKHSNTTTAGFAALLLACSPLYFVYSRLGILEPLLMLETLIAFLLADIGPKEAQPASDTHSTPLLRPAFLGLLMAAMLLTKTTGICAIPALLYLLWMRSADWRSSFRGVLTAVACCAAAFIAYVLAVRRAGLMADFINLFAINDDRVNHKNAIEIFFHAIWDGRMLGYCLLATFPVVALAWLFLFRTDTRARGNLEFSNAILLAIGGFGAFIALHGWLMPRYYLPLVPLLVLYCALGVNALLEYDRQWLRVIGSCIAAALVIAAVSQSITITRWTLHPSFSFQDASRALVATIEESGEQNPVILSSSAEQVALLSPLHAQFINVQFGTTPLQDRVRDLKPGWMLSFDEPNQDALTALQGIEVEHLVLSIPALQDDATHNRLLLYRLTPIN